PHQCVSACCVQDRVAHSVHTRPSSDLGGATAREAAGAAGHGQCHLVGVVVAGKVVELIEHTHRHRRVDGHAGHGGAWLDAEGQVVGRRRDDGEAGGGGPGKAAGTALAQGVGAGGVQDQVVESGDGSGGA